MEDGQLTQKHRLDFVVLLMLFLCVIAGILAYLLVLRGSQPLSQDFSSEVASDGFSEGLVAPENEATIPDDFSILQDELTAFDLELTDVMAPLPMEGVEPAGASGN